MEALKQAISTLTLVNKRKEMEFKKDRRMLVASSSLMFKENIYQFEAQDTKNELQRRCDELEQQIKNQKQMNRAQNLVKLGI